MTRQEEKAEAFRALHAGEAFVMPNPWDAGSARVLEALGFKALATTSSGFAFTLGRLDGSVTLDEMVAHLATLDRVTDLPISVDLENGYGPEPDAAALAVTRVAEAGAVGGSIEDYDPAGLIYELDHAVERITAAAEAARAFGFPFTLTARAENHLRGNPDLEDTIARLQAYERAGADVLVSARRWGPRSGQRAPGGGPRLRRDRRTGGSGMAPGAISGDAAHPRHLVRRSPRGECGRGGAPPFGCGGTPAVTDVKEFGCEPRLRRRIGRPDRATAEDGRRDRFPASTFAQLLPK
jgi:Phosphoenolpyruvate phosphomutase